MPTVSEMVRKYHNETGEPFKPQYEFSLDQLVDEIVNKARYVDITKYAKFVGYNLITDARKVNYYIPKRVKKRKGRGKKDVNAIPMDKRYLARLELIFEHQDGTGLQFKQVLFLPRKINKYHYSINGSRLYLLNQLVDFSTYTHNDDVVMKTSTTGIRLKRNKKKIVDMNGEVFNTIQYQLNMFGDKICSPLLFFLCDYEKINNDRYKKHESEEIVETEFGAKELLDSLLIFLQLDLFTTITKEPNNFEGFDTMSFPLGESLYINVKRAYFEGYQYIRGCVASMIHIFEKGDFVGIPDQEDWRYELGKAFKVSTAKRKLKLQKADDVIVSYNLGLDHTTRKVLKDKIQLKNLESTSTLIRWLMQNYEKLYVKDHYDYRNKRVRKEEYIAYQYGSKLLKGIHRIMNSGKRRISPDHIEGAILTRPDVLLIALSKSQMATHDDMVNDMDGWIPFKYTMKGPNGLGKSKTIAVDYKKLHHSQIGIVDVNTTSSSDPGLSGVMCPLRDFGGKKYFSDRLEAEIYDSRIRSIENKLDIIYSFKEMDRGIRVFKEY